MENSKNKPGPKINKFGKKKTYSFTLSQNAHHQLEELSVKTGCSASNWIEQKILEEAIKSTLVKVQEALTISKIIAKERMELEIIEELQEKLKLFDQFRIEHWVLDRACHLNDQVCKLHKYLKNEHDVIMIRS